MEAVRGRVSRRSGGTFKGHSGTLAHVSVISAASSSSADVGHFALAFPNCLETGRDLAIEHYDAITEFSYPYIVEPRDGPRP